VTLTNQLIGSMLDNLTVVPTLSELKQGVQDWRRNNEVPHFNRLYFFVEGEGAMIINGRTYYPRVNQMVILPAGTTQTFQTDADHPYTRYFCDFYAKIGEWPLFHGVDHAFIANMTDPERIKGIFEELRQQIRVDQPTARLRTKAALLQLIASCIEEGGYHDFLHPFVASPERDKLAQVLLYIESRLSQPLGVEELARQIHFHPNYFIPYFKKHMGEPPMHYVQRRRLDEAKRLLYTTDRSISDIAQALNMDLAHFSKQFKQYTGLSPSVYRGSGR
jgi:AraC-like DNA-binding protein